MGDGRGTPKHVLVTANVIKIVEDIHTMLGMENRARSVESGLAPLPTPEISRDTTIGELAEIFLEFSLEPRVLSKSFHERLVRDAHTNGREAATKEHQEGNQN